MSNQSVTEKKEERLMRLFKVVFKAQMRSQVRREKLKGFRRDEKKLEALEIGLLSDDLLEIQLSDTVTKFETQNKDNSIREFGDGTLLQMILDFLKSEEFEKVMQVILEFIKELAGLF